MKYLIKSNFENTTQIMETLRRKNIPSYTLRKEKGEKAIK